MSEKGLVAGGSSLQILSGLMGAAEGGVNRVVQDRMRRQMAKQTRAQQADIRRREKRAVATAINNEMPNIVGQIENDADSAVQQAESILAFQLKQSREQAKAKDAAAIFTSVIESGIGLARLLDAEQRGVFSSTELTPKAKRGFV